MKVYLRNPENFFPETVKFYYQNFEIINQSSESDIIIINDFTPIETSKIVACNSTGVDHIKSPEVISLLGEDLFDLTAVPELCIGMAIYCTRIFRNEEIRGKNLGIIGHGRIGRQLGFYANSLGMKINYVDNKDNKDSFEKLLSESDVVSLHITSSEENRNFFDREKFELMKEGSIFLNSARPWLVDEEAMMWALDNKLSGAWIDFETVFLKHPKVITTNHLGGSTKESRKKSEMILAKKLLQYVSSKSNY